MAAEDEGAGVVVLEAAGAGLAGAAAGADVGGEAGVAGAAGVVWSDALGAASFFSPVLGAGGSLPDDGFILSE